MKVGIYGQFYHAHSGMYIEELLNSLEQENIEMAIEEEFLQFINTNHEIIRNFRHINTFQSLDSSFDMLISVGGDGTILKAVNFVKDLDIPIMGINTGRLGFLATVNKEDIKQTLVRMLKKDYNISERSLLSIETNSEEASFAENSYALNEIAVSRKNTTTMITVDTWLNDEYLTAYWADGLIVSTPTGSTGYSLSCGGPVITPATRALVITPIAPHNLNARPLVVRDNTVIQLKVTGREANYLVSMDSRVASLKNETVVTIKKAPFKIKMVEFSDETFLKTLRKKLLWGEDKRN